MKQVFLKVFNYIYNNKNLLLLILFLVFETIILVVLGLKLFYLESTLALISEEIESIGQMLKQTEGMFNDVNFCAKSVMDTPLPGFPYIWCSKKTLLIWFYVAAYISLFTV